MTTKQFYMMINKLSLMINKWQLHLVTDTVSLQYTNAIKEFTCTIEIILIFTEKWWLIFWKNVVDLNYRFFQQIVISKNIKGLVYYLEYEFYYLQYHSNNNLIITSLSQKYIDKHKSLVLYLFL